MMQRYAGPLDQIEQRYGVPGQVLVAIWGLETGFGTVTGKFETLSALATLAYDCRRTDKFHEELIAALKIVQRGDLAPDEMRGAWAGEIGQTQFMPTSYLKYGQGDMIRNPVGRAVLHRQLPEGARLAARPGLGRGPAELPASCWNGTPPPSIPRPSACSPPRSPAATRNRSEDRSAA